MSKKKGSCSFQTKDKAGGGRQISVKEVGKWIAGKVLGGLSAHALGIENSLATALASDGHCAQEPGVICTQHTGSSRQQPDSAAAGATNGDHNNTKVVKARMSKRPTKVM
ncbi:hypothetical protein F9Z44_13650 [Hydrogenophaga sp. PBL-H3]|uniref:hypothetical protein n=1 Tax=Hydrogenophaga sp. PBL-H3 TaxID=434010 RepID=UPI00131F704B|nr:hypothetical protein [Hydrogenophaga sp. PBL-H3]QHE77016.1 hypothetical protein F9Z45_13650 [Hydrogenophaga sp. PBL-H3]QHE81440.1 hypothetical protein F9Z44_13650 [Hydrogenophaga sp. PBL-H3]